MALIIKLIAIIICIILIFVFYKYKYTKVIKRLVNNKHACTIIPGSKEYYMKLFTLYYYGIEDKYDLENNLIDGFSPDYTRAIYYLKKCIDLGFYYGYLILAMIYQYNLKDNNKAIELYKFIISNNFDKYMKDQAHQHTQQINNNINIVSRELEFRNYIMDEMRLYEDGHSMPMQFINKVNLDHLNIAENEVVPLEYLERVSYVNWNDSQNVHDPQVLATINKSLNDIQKSTDINKTSLAAFNDIKNYIEQMLDSDKKYNALKALKVLKKENSYINKLNMSEMEILRLIWNRINCDQNDDSIINLKENLFNELVDMIQGNVVVCATGRAARLCDTLSIIDPELSIKSKYMIREEMMNKCGVIRRNLLSSENEHDRKRLEQGKHTEQAEWEFRLKKSIRDIFQLEYVKTNIMSQKEFNEELNSWIDYI